MSTYQELAWFVIVKHTSTEDNNIQVVMTGQFLFNNSERSNRRHSMVVIGCDGGSVGAKIEFKI